MIHFNYQDGQEKHLDSPKSGWKDQASGCSPKFEKFQNSFSDTKIVDRPDSQDFRSDAYARDSNYN